MASESARGTVNATLWDLGEPPGELASARGTVNATLFDPGAEPIGVPSARGTVNATLTPIQASADYRVARHNGTTWEPLLFAAARWHPGSGWTPVD